MLPQTPDPSRDRVAMANWIKDAIGLLTGRELRPAKPPARQSETPDDLLDIQPKGETMADEASEGTAETTGYLVHQPGTFPVTGRKVAFSASDTRRLSGRIEAKISWDTTNSPRDIVIHLCAFLVDDEGKVVVGNPFYCVNHDNDRSKDGSTLRRGRRQHGDVKDDETITVNLGDVDPDVRKIVFAAYIQDAEALRHSFEVMVDAAVTFTHTPEEEDTSAQRIATHTLDRDYNLAKTAVILGEIYRRSTDPQKDRGWSYRDIGQGRASLIDVGAEYGVVFIGDDE